jgi:hypothetical protein
VVELLHNSDEIWFGYYDVGSSSTFFPLYSITGRCYLHLPLVQFVVFSVLSRWNGVPKLVIQQEKYYIKNYKHLITIQLKFIA